MLPGEHGANHVGGVRSGRLIGDLSEPLSSGPSRRKGEREPDHEAADSELASHGKLVHRGSLPVGGPVVRRRRAVLRAHGATARSSQHEEASQTTVAERAR